MSTVTALQSVLALEFRGVGDTADFSFLTRGYAPALITRVDPISQHIEKPLTLAGQAGQLVAQQPRHPDIVLAYCGTAALGLHIAALIDADTLLVDPYPITDADLFRDFTNLCTGMGFDPEALAAVTREANLESWEAFLLTRRDIMAAEHGGDGEAYELVDDLFDRYRSWLRFLFANAASAPAEPRGEILAITARLSVALEPMLADPSRAQVRRVNYEEGGLLESPVIQDVVSIALSWNGMSGV